MMVFNPFIYHPYKAVQYNILSRNKFAAVLFKKNNGDRMTDRQTDLQTCRQKQRHIMKKLQNVKP